MILNIVTLILFSAYISGWIALALNVQHKIGRPLSIAAVALGTFLIFYPQIRAAAIWIYQLF